LSWEQDRAKLIRKAKLTEKCVAIIDECIAICEGEKDGTTIWRQLVHEKLSTLRREITR
jgi:hypothetical protein